MKRRVGFLRFLAVALLAVLALSACTPSDSAGSTGLSEVRYGGQFYPGEFVLFGESSIWDTYGVEVDHTLFSSGGEGNEALVAGNVDINCGADSKTIALFNALPDDALIIGTVQRGNRYSTIVRNDAPYESWDDLRGKTVATRFGTGAEGVLRRFYAQEGYAWEDFQYVNLKIEDMIAALGSGQIEAFTAWEPTPAIAEARGIGRVLRTYGDVALVPASIHTTRQFAGDHPEEVVRFLAAHLEKAELIQNEPARAAQIAADAAAKKGITIDPEAFQRVFERIDFSIQFDEQIINSIYETAEFLLEQNKIAETPELVWDTSYVEQAIELRNEMA